MHTKKLVGIVLATSFLSACGGTPTLPTPTAMPTTPVVTSTPTLPATSTPTSPPAASGQNPEYLTKAASLNPGTSLSPTDKGKTMSSDTFKYTLLDVRDDQSQVFMGTPLHVVLVKLEVENISVVNKNLSIAEVRLKADDPNAGLGKGDFTSEFLYSRTNVGIDLGADVAVLKPGEKVVGYYIYKYEPYTKLYFNIYSLGTDPVTGEAGSVVANILKKAGTFTIKG